MFASIKTNGASHIVISIPHEGSEKSLPALARMLEKNAVFINRGYQETTVVKAEMSIILGTEFRNENSENTILIAESGPVLDDDFVGITPEIMVSNSKAMKREKDENSRLRTELNFVKQQLAVTKEQIDALTAIQD